MIELTEILHRRLPYTCLIKRLLLRLSLYIVAFMIIVIISIIITEYNNNVDRNQGETGLPSLE